MTQDEWLFKIAGIARKTRKVTKYSKPYYREEAIKENIKDLTGLERNNIIAKMEQYWIEHKPSSLEFLFNNAVVACTKGSKLSKVRGIDHGVYTDAVGGQALLNEDDVDLLITDGTVFGSCVLLTGKNRKCKAKEFTQWYGVNENTKIGENKNSLTMDSYIICPYFKNVHIQPVTSGQEFTFSNSLFRYPKFVVEREEDVLYSNMVYWDNYNFYNASIDMIVIRKLAIRNMSFLNPAVDQISSKGYYERKWLEYLAKYMLLCNDKNILKNVINAFYEDVEVSIVSRGERRELLGNYNLLMESASLILNEVIEQQNNESYLKAIGVLQNGENSIIRIIENYFLTFMINRLYIYTTVSKASDDPPIELKQIAVFAEQRSDDIEAYYKNGTRIDYATDIYYADETLIQLRLMSEGVSTAGDSAITDVVCTYTYISPLKMGDDIDDMDEVWKYFDKNKKTFFGETLLVNVIVTVLLNPIESTAIALAASLIWTVVGSFGAQKAEETLQNEFDNQTYGQSGSSLKQLIKSLKAYLIYANTGRDYHSFMYNILPGKETEKRIYIFLDNIGKIYLKEEKGTNEKCLLDILKLRDNVKGTIYEKINQLMKALTTTIPIREIPGVEIDGVETGMGILKNLKQMSVKIDTVKGIESFKVETNVLLDGKKISIGEFNCCTGSGIDMNILFSELLRKN